MNERTNGINLFSLSLMDVKYLKSMNFHVKQIYRFFKFFVSRFNHFAVIVFLWFLLFLSSKCLCLSNLYILWTCVYIIRQPATKRCWNEQLSWWQMKKPYDQCPINVYFYVQCDHRVQWQWRGIHQQVQQKWTGQVEPPEAECEMITRNKRISVTIYV